jgi:hypothetical protein
MKLIAGVISIMTLLGMFFAAYCWLDSNYASAETVKAIEQRLDYKIKTDQEQSIQERIWKIKDKFGEKPKDLIIKEELRKLENDLTGVSTQIKVLEKK